MSKLVVVFPGIGYHCDKPLLYYGRNVAHECGYTECIKISYSYDGKNIRGNRKKMDEAFMSLYDQAKESLKDVNWEDYEEILFMSKSIGTVIASDYAKEIQLNVRHVLYTPLVDTFEFVPKNATAFIGTNDPWSDVSKVIDMANANGTDIYVYEACNHSLECEDTVINIKNLEDIMNKTKAFLKKK